MRILLVIIIMAVAVGAGYMVLQTAKPQQPVNTIVEEQPTIEAVNILVARKSIPLGTIITEDMIDQQPWPKHLVLSGFILSGGSDTNVIGMVARSEFQAQEPLNKFKLANPNDANFIAASLPNGKRAVTLSVDAISGVAGFIFAGDRIDIIMTHRIPDNIGNNVGRQQSNAIRYSEIVMSDIKVLAVDIRGMNQAPEGGGQQAARAPNNITIEVTPEQARQLRLAELNGTLSLALRPLKDQKVITHEVSELGSLTGVELKGEMKSDEVFIIRGVQQGPPGMGSGYGGAF